MEISHLSDLLAGARSQAKQQRLLVFASASLPPNASAEQRAKFESGESAELSGLIPFDRKGDAVQLD